MKNLNMNDLLDSRFAAPNAITKNLFIACLKVSAADEALGVLQSGGKWRVKDICAAIPTKVSIQRMTDLLRTLVAIGKVKREEVEGEPAKGSMKMYDGSLYTWVYTPTIAYYSIA